MDNRDLYLFIKERAAASAVANAAEAARPYVEGTITELSRDDITKIGWSVFWGCSFLEAVNCPKVTEVDEQAFFIQDDGATSLRTVNLPAAITIGAKAFRGCTELQTFSAPRSETIGHHAFFKCTSLTSVDLGWLCSWNVNVITFGESIFEGCTSLVSVKLGSIRPQLGFNAFRDTPIDSGSGTIYVPNYYVNAYKSDSIWSTYASQIVGY